MALLNDLHFDIAHELKSLCTDVALLMTANGLRSDDNAIDQWSRPKVGVKAPVGSQLRG